MAWSGFLQSPVGRFGFFVFGAERVEHQLNRLADVAEHIAVTDQDAIRHITVMLLHGQIIDNRFFFWLEVP